MRTMTDVVARVASEGVSVGFAHCVAALPGVPAHACRMVIATIVVRAANKNVTLSIIIVGTGSRNAPLPEHLLPVAVE